MDRPRLLRKALTFKFKEKKAWYSQEQDGLARCLKDQEVVKELQEIK
jgi:hypothetical protein